MCDIKDLVQRVVDNAKDVALNDTPVTRRLLDYSIKDIVDTYNKAFDKNDEFVDELSRQIGELQNDLSELQNETDKCYKRIQELTARDAVERKNGEGK